MKTEEQKIIQKFARELEKQLVGKSDENARKHFTCDYEGLNTDYQCEYEGLMWGWDDAWTTFRKFCESKNIKLKVHQLFDKRNKNGNKSNR